MVVIRAVPLPRCGMSGFSVSTMLHLGRFDRGRRLEEDVVDEIG